MPDTDDHWTKSARKAAKARWDKAAEKRAVDLPGEEWRPVPSWPGYEASSEGRVRSAFKVLKGTPLKKTGHLMVCPSIGGKQEASVGAHIMVCEAFHGPCPENHECRHLDGKSDNNRPGNLKWGTRLENQRDRITHGTTNRGEANGQAKLTREQAMEIYRRATAGEDQNFLALEFQTSQANVSAIKTRRKWRAATASLISQ